MTKPLAGETVKIRKKVNSSNTRFSISKAGKDIAVLSDPKVKTKIASKILEYEKKSYSLLEDCEIEEIVYWSDPNIANNIKFKEVLCRIQMSLT